MPWGGGGVRLHHLVGEGQGLRAVAAIAVRPESPHSGSTLIFSRGAPVTVTTSLNVTVK